MCCQCVFTKLRVVQRNTMSVQEVVLLALHLRDHADPTSRLLKFAVEGRTALKRVCRDILDALLICDQPNEASFTMARFALLLGVDEIATRLTLRTGGRTCNLFRHVQLFSDRRWAMGLCSVLLQASVSNAPQSNSLFCGVALRKQWLWALLSNGAFSTLVERSRAWPAIYVAECWHELAPYYSRRASTPHATLRVAMAAENSNWHLKHAMVHRTKPGSH
jgi:hypothetical protein